MKLDFSPRSTANAMTILLALLASLLVSPGPAAGFDQYAEFCRNDPTRSIVFSGDSEWNLTLSQDPSSKLKDPFQSGYDVWTGANGPLAYHGGKVFRPGGSFEMDIESGWKLNGAGAVTVCSLSNPLSALTGRGIQVNRDKVAGYIASSSYDSLAGLSAHEWGHAWGLGHSGVGDSHQGNPPTMATCITNGARRATLSQDEYAASSYLTGSETVNGFHSVTANDSFEMGTSFWARAGATNLTTRNGGADGTPTAARIGPSNNNQSIYSTTRVTDQVSAFGDGTVASDDFFARVNVKDTIVGNRGHVLLRFYARGIRYKDGTDLGCNFYGDDKNIVEQVGTWTYGSKIYYPISNWSYCDTGTFDAPSNGLDFEWGDYPDAVDVRIRMWNRVTNRTTGLRNSVLVDRARIKWNF